MGRRLLNKLESDELAELSKFFMDVAKGLLGAPLVIYLVTGFSGLVIAVTFVVDLVLVIGSVALAIYLSRQSKRRKRNG